MLNLTEIIIIITQISDDHENFARKTKNNKIWIKNHSVFVRFHLVPNDVWSDVVHETENACAVIDNEIYVFSQVANSFSLEHQI